MSYITNMKSIVADESKDIKKGKVGTALGLVQSHCIKTHDPFLLHFQKNRYNPMLFFQFV